ncbi:hypothetical protein [Mahella australiensis]|uniref:hypothetical protein n=1 Tax=Mahella australiensis TaxID=252966 RepID=UPI0011D2A840|nr:hypothetical protein [Mahella australiensis]
MDKWDQEKAWSWYNSRPWLMGYNHVTGSVKNDIEMWQEATFEESLTKTDREFRLAEETGFNAIRIFLPEVVWKYQRKSFLDNLQRFVHCAGEHGLGVVIVFLMIVFYRRKVRIYCH